MPTQLEKPKPTPADHAPIATPGAQVATAAPAETPVVAVGRHLLAAMSSHRVALDPGISSGRALEERSDLGVVAGDEIFFKRVLWDVPNREGVVVIACDDVIAKRSVIPPSHAATNAPVSAPTPGATGFNTPTPGTMAFNSPTPGLTIPPSASPTVAPEWGRDWKGLDQ